MLIHGPGRMGEGPNSRPRRFLTAVGGGGGFAVFRVLGGELPPTAKPRRPLRSGEPPLVVVFWVTGLDGGAACRGVRRVVLCGAQGSWGAVGVAGVGAPTLVGW